MTTVESGKESDAHLAKLVLQRTTHDASTVYWGTREHKVEAFDLHARMTGGKRLKLGCPPCSFTVINYFRKLENLPDIQDAAPEHLSSQRLAICRGSLEDGSDKCEHLAWPGMNCGLCLCFVDLKARMKNQKCPAGKW